MRGEQRVRRVCRAAVLPLVLLLTVVWAAMIGLGRGEPLAAADLTRLTMSAVVPPSATPVLPEARLVAKPPQAALFVLLATVVALLLGGRRRVRWPAATATAAAATPSMLLHTVRGRAPPRLPA